jgi:hypothetical protein
MTRLPHLPGNRDALDLLLRAAAIAFVTILILGLLPAITRAAA